MSKRTQTDPLPTFRISTDGFETFAAALNQASERNQAMLQTSLQAWETEVGRYFDELATHSRDTMAALGKCEAPLDVLAVEQKWIQARTQAYLDSGLRFAKVFAEAAASMQPPAAQEGAPAAAA